MGEKPLYVWTAPSGDTVFASELKSITSRADFACEIHPVALGGYLLLNYVPGEATLLRDAVVVQKRVAGISLSFRAGGVAGSAGLAGAALVCTPAAWRFGPSACQHLIGGDAHHLGRIAPELPHVPVARRAVGGDHLRLFHPAFTG